MALPGWLASVLWGSVAAAALLAGAVVAYTLAVPRTVIGLITAFGSGVLIAALSLELMEDAFALGGFDASAIGFLAGAALFGVLNWLLSRHGARHRKRSGPQQPSEAEKGGSGLAIALGALLDGVPEAIVLGISLLEPSGVSMAVVAAICISNFPESLASTTGMKAAGRTGRYVFGVWGAIALVTVLGTTLGFAAGGSMSNETIALTTSLAAGAVLAMLAETMIPEAFEEVHHLSGIATVSGFLLAFIIAKLETG